MEEFIDIPGYESYYAISKTGVVISLDRWVDHPLYPNGRRFIKGAVLTQSINSNGYFKVGLSKNNILKNYTIHTLLGRVFIPNPNKYLLIRHLNDIKTDNRLENLAWGTAKDNAQDSIRNGTFVKFNAADISRWNKGRKAWNRGRVGAEATASKIVCDLETGIFYVSCKEAAEAKGMNHNTLRAKLCGINKNNTLLIYV